MIAEIRAELIKQRSTRTLVLTFAAMVALISLAMVVHAFGLPVAMLGPRENQLMVLGVGERLSVLFGAMFGAMVVTVEFRHGTIRPTLLAAPKRSRLIAAKVLVAGVVGAIFALAGSTLALVLGQALLGSRGIGLALTDTDLWTLVLGAGVGGCLWATIGVGLGALGRNQVPVLIGISAWLLFVETLLVEENSSAVEIGRFAPGAAAAAIAGMGGDTLLPPGAALVVLVVYAVAAVGAGWLAFERRDVH